MSNIALTLSITFILCIYSTFSYSCHSTYPDDTAYGDYSDGVTKSQCDSGYNVFGCMGTSSNRYQGSLISFSTNDCYSFGHTDVEAEAVCCDFPCECTRRAGGWSGTNTGDRSYATCQESETLMGCTTFAQSSSGYHNGGYPEFIAGGDRCVSENMEDNPSSTGVMAYASCCECDSTVDCISMESGISGTSDGALAAVWCPVGYTMTSCQGYTKGGLMLGTYIQSNTKCKAINRDGGTGVWAHAICCKVD